MTQLSPEVPEHLREAVAYLIQQALDQGLPREVSDPAVIARIADIIRGSRERRAS